MLSLTKRDEREHRRAEGPEHNKAIDGEQQRETAESQHQEELALRSMIYETHSLVFPKTFFLLSLEIILNLLFFCILIDEWQKGAHSISSNHSNSLHSK